MSVPTSPLQGTDLYALVAADTTLVRKTKDEFSGPCMKCGGEDRFYCNPSAGWWSCRQCSPHRGDIPGYLMFRDGVSYPKALEMLGEQDMATNAGAVPHLHDIDAEHRAAFGEIARACHANLTDDPTGKARGWLEARGIGIETIESVSLGWNPGTPGDTTGIAGFRVPCGITIPLWGVDGALYGVQVRRSVKPKVWPEGKDWRYQTVGGSVVPLYGHYTPYKRTATMLVEGQFDALLLDKVAGDVLDIAATGSNKDHLDERWLTYLSNHHDWLIAYDSDEPGRKGAQGWTDWSERARIVAMPEGCKDPSEYWKTFNEWFGPECADEALRNWVEQQLDRTA